MATVLLAKAIAIYFSSGQIAILITFDLIDSEVYHFFVKSPVYSSSKFYYFSSFFIHKENWPLADPTIKPFENTQIAVKAKSCCWSITIF